MKRLTRSEGVYVGIDQSATGTAVTVLRGGVTEARLFWADSKKAAKDLASVGARPPVLVKGGDEVGRVARLDDIRVGLGEFLRRVSPEFAALEGYAMTKAPIASRVLGEVGGLVRLVLWSLRIPFRVYEIDDIKKFATGSYKAEKAEMVLACRDRWEETNFMRFGKVEGAAGNLADSYAIARMLEVELRIRAGELAVGDVDADAREVFNKTTKARPTNYLSTPFVAKE